MITTAISLFLFSSTFTQATAPAPAPAEPVEEAVGLEVVTPAQLWYGPDDPAFDRVVNLMTARPARPGTFLVLVGHRADESLALNGHLFYDYLGFDAGGLKVPLGLRYGIMDRLDVGLLRLNDSRNVAVNGTSETADVYQLDGRYQILKQDKAGADLAIVGGVTWFVAPDKSTFGGYGQLIASRVSFDRLHAGVSLMIHSSSTNPNKAAGDASYSLAAAAFAELRILTGLAWSLEATEALAGYRDRFPIWTTGPKIITHRHTFSFVVTNSQFVSADGIVANTSRGGSQLIFGFNLTREI